MGVVKLLLGAGYSTGRTLCNLRPVSLSKECDSPSLLVLCKNLLEVAVDFSDGIVEDQKLFTLSNDSSAFITWSSCVLPPGRHY